MTTDRGTSTGAADLARRERELRQGNAEWQREQLAARLHVPLECIKPCVALIGRIHEGRRQEFCRVVVIELVKAGAAEEDIRGHIGYFVESQCEQPPLANRPFTHKEAEQTIRSVLAKAKRERILGHGCINPASPLLEFCPYGAPEGRYSCPYVRGLIRAPKRKGISSLIGALNLLLQHPVPPGWSERQRARRALLTWTVAALEQLKGYGGAELVTSEAELVRYLPTRTTRRTVRRDLAAMRDAGQIRWAKGKSRKGRAGLPPEGVKILRLFPGDAAVTVVKDVFPTAEEDR